MSNPERSPEGALAPSHSQAFGHHDDVIDVTKVVEGCTQSPTFWYAEGNIILLIDDAVFRLHRGFLATHSAIFSDAFSIQQPDDVPLYDGCQVISLVGDSPLDWERLLMFMYQSHKVNPWLTTTSIDELSTLMKLAQKYALDHLYDSCIKRIETELPQTFSDYERIYPVIPERELERQGYSLPQLLPSLVQNKNELITLINFAVEMGIQSILPVAYYIIMTQFTTEEITNGVLDANSSRKVLNHDSQSAIVKGLGILYPRMLRGISRWTEDNACDKPWTRACQEARELEEEVVGPGNVDSDAWPDCDTVFKRIRTKAIRYLAYHPRAKEFAMASCRPGEEFGDMFDGMCNICRESELDARERVRREF